VVAFGSYLLAERMHVSGVMAVVAAGIVIGNYGMPRNMSASTRLAINAFWEYAAFVVNSIVFLLIGIEVAYVRWADKIGLAIGAIAVVLIGRAAIYPLSIVVNKLKGDIPLAWQHILFWGGLRGALSMALVLGLGRDFPMRSQLIAATFAVVLFSLLAQGMTLGPLLQRLGVVSAQPGDAVETRRLASEIMACEAALSELKGLRDTEAHPSWAIELIVERYRVRLADLRAEMSRYQPDYAAAQDAQAREARRTAITAEKGAYQEAERQGWLSEDEWRQIRGRLDSELLEVVSRQPVEKS
jgi:CPA1 family monovalent cation:H+ antiporter